MRDYQSFIKSKSMAFTPAGFAPMEMNSNMFAFQKAVVSYAVRRGKVLLGEGCGLGKSLQELEFASQCIRHKGCDALILAPLAVSHQTKREGQKFGYEVNVCRTQADVKHGINIANYEMLHHFDPSKFGCVILDEGSILKNMDGSTRNTCIEMFRSTPFKMIATATPAPNDYMELGNHAEFLGVMRLQEMLSMYFVHDGGETSKWRLKGHAQDAFWKWLASWAIIIRRPSDIGFDDTGYVLPALRMHRHIIDGSIREGELFASEAHTLEEQRAEKRASLEKRVQKSCDIINSTDGAWIVWGELNDECDMLQKQLGKKCRQLSGSMDQDEKEAVIRGFSDGDFPILVTKPKIAAFGMNWQHCSNQCFASVTHSYEQQYQAWCRSWRFGQKNEVHIHQVMTESETPIIKNFQRKHAEADEMAESMIAHMSDAMKINLGTVARDTTEYNPGKRMTLPEFMRAK